MVTDNEIEKEVKNFEDFYKNHLLIVKRDGVVEKMPPLRECQMAFVRLLTRLRLDGKKYVYYKGFAYPI